MPEKSFANALNEQVANEFAASQQYVAIAVYYDAETLPRLAAFFYRQALEEREHAMMMIQYLLDAGHPIEIPAIKAPADGFADGVAPVRWRSSRRSGSASRSTHLFEHAREVKDYQGEQFLQWFVKEQVEEVASMSAPAEVVERAKDNLLLAEEYLARESLGRGEGVDPTAPAAAGGALLAAARSRAEPALSRASRRACAGS